MNFIQPLNMESFIELLLSLKDNEEITFGTTANDEALDGYLAGLPIQPEDVESWYFARLFNITEYGSKFILIDYCGGSEAFAIPLSSDGDDTLDESLVKDHIERFYMRCYELDGTDKPVFVETTPVVSQNSDK